MTSGLLLVDKPSGPTSHDAVLMVRRALGERRTGHCGSLDPAATGLLVIVAGEAARHQNRFTSERKTYRGTLRLGVTTDTDDLTGKPLPGRPRAPETVTESELKQVMARFKGRLEQRVPLFSAVKVGGRRLYEMARRGEAVELPRKTVDIYRFDLLRFAPPEAEFFVECSKGAYIRSLARDVGEALGVGAALASLRREAVGLFQVGDAYRWDGRRDVPRDDLLKHLIPLSSLHKTLRLDQA